MHCKKILSLLTTIGLLATSVSGINAYDQNIETKTKNTVETTYNYDGGPTDLAVANEDKIIEMLKREGKIKKDASYEEAYKTYISYMKQISKNNNKPLTKQEKELKAKEQKNKKQANPKTYKVKNNEVTEVNVLAVLVEYSDYEHGEITKEETDMYYENYEKQHYEDMLFGENGYVGPNGEKLVSMKQYYDQQSGGTLKINGKVTDWYVAPNTAKYYGEQIGNSNDARPRNLVADALKAMGEDKKVDLSEFDKIDRYDLDGDGNYDEPDGMIDYLMLIHAGVGEEAGGGSLGSDAVWSHRWNLGGLYPIPGTEYTDENGKTRPYYAYDYTLNPEDGAAGVFSHEFGHDLGMPDEYDTQYTSPYSEPISNWSLMSSGSWAGKIPGTEPTGISPYSRQLMQETWGGNWQNQITIDYKDLNTKGTTIDLKQASETGQAIRIDLPDLETEIVKPTSGENMYWGGKGQDGAAIKNSMDTTLDLTNTTNPTLNFKTFYDIEEGWDFASVQVREVGTEAWKSIQGNITTTDSVEDAEVVVDHGITGTSSDWVDATFDLKDYVGKNIELKIEYETDAYTFGQGFYVDDITVVDGDNILLSDDAEGDPVFNLNGFNKDTGTAYSKNYYLIEWRNHDGVDKGLAGISSLGKVFKYDPGMVVWYVNEFYGENWTGVHPGGGYLSVVDADQNNIPWIFEDKTTVLSSNKYQMHDAAFSSKAGSKFTVDLTQAYGRMAVDKFSSANSKFTDSKDFTNSEIPELGVKLPNLGLEIRILKQAKDNTGATISISKK